jgi:hypothetical protein
MGWLLATGCCSLVYAAAQRCTTAGAIARLAVKRHIWIAAEYEDEYDREYKIFVLVLVLENANHLKPT